MSNSHQNPFFPSDYSNSTAEGDKFQRFTDDILNKPTRSTAKRHSFSMTPTIERQDSGDATRFIPGAYPTSEKRDGSNFRHLAGLHGSKVGSGFMLDEGSKPFPKSQLPTTEKPSGSSIGVGSLPGSINESGVALLPEERIHPDPYLGENLNLGKDHGHAYASQEDEDQLPTHEHPSGSRVGVGSLPGPNSEAGVAILPEERLNTDPMVGPVAFGPYHSKSKGHHHHKHTKYADEDVLPTHEHPSGSKVGVGSLPGSNREVGVAILPEERIHPDPIVGAVDAIKKPTDKGCQGCHSHTKGHHSQHAKHAIDDELPTHEHPSGSKVGVGSLPGSNREVGVAILPEERIHPDPIVGGVDPLTRPANKGRHSHTKGHHSQQTEHKYDDQLPTHEHPSGSKVGVGSLPGSNREVGVAILPEERIHPDPIVGRVDPMKRPANYGRHSHNKGHHSQQTEHKYDDQLPTHEHPSGSKVGVGSLPGSNREVGVAILPEERIHPDPIVGRVDPMKRPAIKGRHSHNKGHHTKHAQHKYDDQLPTHEHPSGSKVGVGSLPGPNREAGVAILPEERIHPDPIVGAVGIPGPLNERTFHKPQDTRRHHEKKSSASSVDKSELPTHEHPSGSKVGVGSLPGPNREAGVAILPEERIHPDPIVGPVSGAVRPSKHKEHSFSKTHHAGRMDRGRQLPTREHPSGSRVGIGSMPGGAHEPGVATLPEERVDGRPYGSGHTGFEDHLVPEHPSHPSHKKQTPKHSEHKNMPKRSHQKAELPTTEKPSGSRVGIGSMPGSIREAGVATLPEERIDGRPYGSGHTGFEDTLGHGHTFRQSHPKEDTSQPTSKPKHKTSQIVVDDQARKYLEEQNPCLSPSRPKQKPQGLPGDTIFSATQRALKEDPTFIHGSLGTGFMGESHNAPSKPQQNTGSANPFTYGDHKLQGPPASNGPSVIQSMEGAAKEAIHGAENVLHNVEERARAWSQQPAQSYGTNVRQSMEGAAKEAMHGAEHVIHNIEEGAKAYIPRGFTSYFAGSNKTTNTATTVAQNRQQPYEASSRNVNVPPKLNTVIPEDEDIPEAIHKGQISGTQSTLPPFIESEYHKLPSKDDLHDESGVSSNFSSQRQSLDIQRERDLGSDRDGAKYGTEDTKTQSTPSEDADNIQYGYGGVGFNLAGKDGILPGYPTREGMNKLISERMRDDRLRAAGAVNPTKPRSNLPAPSGAVIQDPSTEIVTSDDVSDYDPSSRHIEEKLETPIFEDGAIAASGKFEAVFEVDSGRADQGRRAENPASKDTFGKFNAKSGGANVGGAFMSKEGMKVGYLGKPLSQEQEEIEIERARREAARRMGID